MLHKFCSKNVLYYSCTRKCSPFYISKPSPPKKNSRSRKASLAKPSGLAAGLAFGEDTWWRRALQAWPAVLCARAMHSKTSYPPFDFCVFQLHVVYYMLHISLFATQNSYLLGTYFMLQVV